MAAAVAEEGTSLEAAQARVESRQVRSTSVTPCLARAEIWAAKALVAARLASVGEPPVREVCKGDGNMKQIPGRVSSSIVIIIIVVIVIVIVITTVILIVVIIVVIVTVPVIVNILILIIIVIVIVIIFVVIFTVPATDILILIINVVVVVIIVIIVIVNVNIIVSVIISGLTSSDARLPLILLGEDVVQWPRLQLEHSQHYRESDQV